MPVLISIIGLFVYVPLILDTILTVQKITNSNMNALLDEDIQDNDRDDQHK